jgi:outer membrane receptor protein involved in Fe transport
MFRSIALAWFTVTCLGIAFSAAGAAGVTGAPQARSQQSGHGPVPTELEDVVVTATRSPRTVGDIPMTVTVVRPEEIARSPAKTLDELLRSVPSFTLFRRSSSLGADPSSQGVRLRNIGASGISRALVLVDGIPANDPFGGWVAWRSVPRIGLQRIEVVPGGGSALYGNYALGGVIQAFSKPIEPDDITLSAEYGSFDTATVSARAADRWGRAGASLEGEYFDSAGYPVVAKDSRGSIDGDTPSRHSTLNGHLEFNRSEDLVLDLKTGWFDEDFNGGTKYTTAGLNRLEYSASARYAPAGLGSFDIALFGHDGEFRQDRARVGPGRNSEALSAYQDVPTNDLGASLLWNGPPALLAGTHAITLGADARWIDGTTRERLYPAAASLPTNPTVQRNAGGKQQLSGIFAQDLYDYSDAVSATLAVRYDRWENLSGWRDEQAYDGTATSTRFDDRSGGEFSPKLGLRVRLNDWLTTRATAYRSFRAPTLDELYRPFQAGTIRTESNPDLAPETLRGAEAGFDFGGRSGRSARVTAFWNEMQDPIVNVSTGPNTRQRQNLGQARIQGLEFNSTWAFAAHWSIDAAWTLADTEVTEAPGQPQLIGKELPQAPKNQGHFAIVYDDKLFSANLQLRYIGEQYENDVNTLPMGGVWLTDVFANWHATRHLDVFLAVENLFDETYLVGRSGVDTTGQPRFVHGGVRLKLGG